MIKFIFGIMLVGAAFGSQAQDSPAEFLDSLLKGVQIDSPNVFLYWGSGYHDSLKTDPLLMRELKDHMLGVWDHSTNTTQVRWTSVKVFGIPMDSVYLRYFWPSNHVLGFHWTDLAFDPAYTQQMKALFTRYMGNPAKHRDNQHGRYFYMWHFKHILYVRMARGRFFARRNKGAWLWITDLRVN
jgi:hypothetical protein